jgi:SAM-dependent methyltransferase
MSHDNTAKAVQLLSERCTACPGTMQVFFEQTGLPVNSCILVDSAKKARTFPRGDIRLAFCRDCGFVRNIAFDPTLTEYSERYEETQAYSPTFNSFHERLVDDLIERHGVRNKHVVEIGCGKGEFLALVCARGSNTGLGYDPSYDANRGILKGSQQVEIVREFFGKQSGTQDADVLVCKMTLEHIQACSDFVISARRALKPGSDSIAFFQVPESMRIFRECAFEDIYYEHCSYFTPGSAARMFRRSGYNVVKLDITYAGQYLTLEATNEHAEPGRLLVNEDSVGELESLVATFDERFRAKQARWQQLMAEKTKSRPVVIWGSGSKGVAFLQMLDDSDSVSAAVDINPNRHGKYMLGTGQPIISPTELADIRPGAVIIMNAIYENEIRQSLTNLGVETEVLTL